MKLTPGMQAPAFSTEDVHGQPVSLAGFAGKPLLLTFLRFSTCALCNLQIHKLIEAYPALHGQGLEILAVFESPRENVAANVGRQDVPFTLIADPTASLYDLFVVETSQEKTLAVPADEDWRKGLIAEAAALGYPLQKEEEANFFRMPADILIGPDGRVLAALYSEVIGEHMRFEDIEAALGTLA